MEPGTLTPRLSLRRRDCLAGAERAEGFQWGDGPQDSRNNVPAFDVAQVLSKWPRELDFELERGVPRPRSAGRCRQGAAVEAIDASRGSSVGLQFALCTDGITEQPVMMQAALRPGSKSLGTSPLLRPPTHYYGTRDRWRLSLECPACPAQAGSVPAHAQWWPCEFQRARGRV